ncbi:MAG: PAS domain-containing protein [Chloroflexi bacterium]|nr:MAG: PAS domain-containing protein [Chloroflexota bacterium]TMC26173.1 MAG: PAS domain-containing protein [Chloroflexota bacterium]
MTQLPDGAERRRTRGRRLTDRQTAVLELVANGLGNKEIAHELGISEQAIKEHVSALLRRLEANNRAALAEVAARLRVVGSTDVSADWMDLLFLRAPLLIALLEGADYRFVATNDAYRNAAGPRELIGRTFREAFPDLDDVGVIRLLDDAYRTGEAQSASAVPARLYRDRPAQPALGYLTTLVQPMRRADDTVGGVVFFGLDVTEEVLARNAARELSDEREAILEQLPSGVLTVTPDGVISSINQTGKRILSVGDEILGRLAWDALTFADTQDGRPIPHDQRPLRRALRGEHVAPRDLRGLVTASGEILDMRVSASPLFDGAGKVRGAIAVFTPSRTLS